MRHTQQLLATIEQKLPPGPGFGTLYAKGPHCYVESLSAYARQFLYRMKKQNLLPIFRSRNLLVSFSNAPAMSRLRLKGPVRRVVFMPPWHAALCAPA